MGICPRNPVHVKDDGNGVSYTFWKDGKVKNIYVSPDEKQLMFFFRNDISVFDKRIPSEIPGKGAALSTETAHWSQLMNNNKIKNHYIRHVDANTMIAKRFPVVKKPTTETDSYYIPLEFIARYYAAGSLLDRIADGRIDYRDLGFDHKPEAGERLPQPLVEATTKFEKFDRHLDHKEMLEISGLTPAEYEEAEIQVLKIDNMIEREVDPRGLIHADGKKEFAFDEGRTLTNVDTFGTGDEDRFWKKEPFEKEGKRVEMSKEHVRQYYRNIGYHAELMAAREAGKEEPDIPPLPPEQIVKTSEIYKILHQKITGNTLDVDIEKHTVA